MRTHRRGHRGRDGSDAVHADKAVGQKVLLLRRRAFLDGSEFVFLVFEILVGKTRFLMWLAISLCFMDTTMPVEGRTKLVSKIKIK